MSSLQAGGLPPRLLPLVREHCQPLEGKPGTGKRPRGTLLLSKNGVAPSSKVVPQQGCRGSTGPGSRDLKERGCLKPPTSDLINPALGSCAAKAQTGGTGLGVGGALPQTPPASIGAGRGPHSCLVADTHHLTVAVLSAHFSHGSLGQCWLAVPGFKRPRPSPTLLLKGQHPPNTAS